MTVFLSKHKYVYVFVYVVGSCYHSVNIIKTTNKLRKYKLQTTNKGSFGNLINNMKHRFRFSQRERKYAGKQARDHNYKLCYMMQHNWVRSSFEHILFNFV